MVKLLWVIGIIGKKGSQSLNVYCLQGKASCIYSEKEELSRTAQNGSLLLSSKGGPVFVFLTRS